MGIFNEWFKNNLIIGGFPTIEYLEKNSYDVIINVLDENSDIIHNYYINNKIKYFWFPLSECHSNMGISSIYGALSIIYDAEYNNKKVLLHCHAGANRSVTVQECYYYMRTSQYLMRKRNEKFDNEILQMFQFDSTEDKKAYLKIAKQNRLMNNIEAGHLPARFKMESFLKKCNISFEEKFNIIELSDTSVGGNLDLIKEKSKLYEY